MTKRQRQSGYRTAPITPGNVARSARETLRSYTVGALPILNDLMRRMRLEEFLRAALPPEDRRTKLSPVKALLVLLRNLLLSRPIYGVGEWAARHAPDLLGLATADIDRLNDNCVGRALDRLFLADVPSLVLSVAAHAVKEFERQLGRVAQRFDHHLLLRRVHRRRDGAAILGAAHLGHHLRPQQRPSSRPETTLVHPHGHCRRRRALALPRRKRQRGGQPNAPRHLGPALPVDRPTRLPLRGRLQAGHERQYGLPAPASGAVRHRAAADAREDAAFRTLVAKGQVAWRPLWEKTDNEGNVIDHYSTSEQPATTAEGYRLVWYRSLRKTEADAVARSGRIDKALKQLAVLREKLRSPRTRYRQEAKLAAAVAEILASCGAESWIVTEVQAQTRETFHQDHRGRPGKDTHYVKKVATRFDLAYRIDNARVAAEASGDGIFPLVTNVSDLSDLALLHAYKRQPAIEKRFSQLKTDFEVAPVYLKAVHRIQALLCVYFFALLVEALLERQLRRAMQRDEIDALPLYPEGRACRWPTARRVMDLFESVQRHALAHRQHPTEVLVTELTRLQRRLLRLLGLSAKDYGT